jgi:TonB family protein
MLDKAIEDLSVAMKTYSSHYDYAKRGSLYFKKDDFENALKDYTEAIRLQPNYENHYTMRAEVYRKLGKQSEAEADELKAREFEDKIVETTASPSSPNVSNSKTISGGVLNGKATNLVQPPYPPAAKAVRASGAVNVQVTIDEKGNVVSASAVSGHPLLRASAVAAARESKFSPTLLSGKPVKVTGVVVYNFVP